MTDHDLISLYEKIWQARLNGGYIKLITKADVIVARIAEVKPLVKSQDRTIVLEGKDVYGKPIPARSFKLSEIRSIESVNLLMIKT
jgi:hypothetical protein